MRELAKYVTEQLRASTTVDWQVRESVRAKLRNLVRRALRNGNIRLIRQMKQLSCA
jgi:type I restriction enzyme R subunit